MPLILHAVLSFSGLIEVGAVSLNSMSRMLVTVNGRVPTFKATEALKNLCMTHGLPLKGSCNHFISFSSHLLSSTKNLMHTCFLYSWTSQIWRDTNTSNYFRWLHQTDRLQWVLAGRAFRSMSRCARPKWFLTSFCPSELWARQTCCFV